MWVITVYLGVGTGNITDATWTLLALAALLYAITRMEAGGVDSPPP